MPSNGSPRAIHLPPAFGRQGKRRRATLDANDIEQYDACVEMG